MWDSIAEVLEKIGQALIQDPIWRTLATIFGSVIVSLLLFVLGGRRERKAEGVRAEREADRLKSQREYDRLLAADEYRRLRMSEFEDLLALLSPLLSKWETRVGQQRELLATYRWREDSPFNPRRVMVGGLFLLLVTPDTDEISDVLAKLKVKAPSKEAWNLVVKASHSLLDYSIAWYETVESSMSETDLERFRDHFARKSAYEQSIDRAKWALHGVFTWHFVNTIETDREAPDESKESESRVE